MNRIKIIKMKKYTLLLILLISNGLFAQKEIDKEDLNFQNLFGMAAGTFSVALGIGFVMQNGNVLANRFGAESAPAQPAAFTEAVGEAVTISSQSMLEAPVSAENEIMAIPVVQSGMVLASSPEIKEQVENNG